MQIAPSARQHQISDADIRHAVNNAIGAITNLNQPDFTMVIGPDTSGRLLEVGIIAADDDDWVIHAMPARQKNLDKI